MRDRSGRVCAALEIDEVKDDLSVLVESVVSTIEATVGKPQAAK